MKELQYNINKINTQDLHMTIKKNLPKQMIQKLNKKKIKFLNFYSRMIAYKIRINCACTFASCEQIQN